MNPTPQLASGKAFVLPSDSAIDKFKEKPIPLWAAKKFGYKPSRTRFWDLLHTRLEVAFDWEKQYLLGKASLDLEPYFYPQKTLELDAKGFEIKKVEWFSKNKSISFRQTYDGKKLILVADTSFQKGQKVQLQIEYVAKPGELQAGGSEAITKDIGLYFINPDGKDTTLPRQIWTQGEPESSSCWFPTIDSPNEKCTQEIQITIENQFKTLSNGLLVSSKAKPNGFRTDTWVLNQPHSPYLFMMAIGEYKKVEDKWRNIPVNYWVEPKFEKYAHKIFGNTPAMMEYFSRKLGVDYPWPKYDQVVVRNFVSGAMENTSASTFMEALQVTDRELVDHNWDDIIAHELFHQWFGDLVTLESWANLPLNESFANYSQFLWDEYKNGLDEAEFQALKEENQYFFESNRKREPLIRYYHKSPDDMFDSHSYAKGGRILHFLRKIVGDEAFFKSLEMYLKQNAYNNTEIHHLRLAFEKATGQDLQWFFNQWFLAAGHPELKIIPSYEENRLVLNISQNQDSLYAPIYKIPVLLEVWTEKGCEPRSLQLEKAKETFSLELESKPVFFLFDADNRLPAQVEMQVGVEHWSRQFQFASRAIHRLEALQRLRSDYFEAKETKMAMERALEDSFWAIRQMAVEFLQDAEEEMKKKVLPLVKNLAQKDPQSLVRAQAFKTLGGMAFGAKKEVLELGINDFSIAASGAAFKAYLKEGYSDMDEKIKSLEGENSDLFSPVLAEYFSGRPGEKSWNWFQNALENTSFPDPYNLIQNFAKHLNLLKDSARINAGLQSLFLLAEKRKRPEVQIGVFQVTKSYKSWPGISEKRKRIKAENKNEEVGEILDYLE